MSLQIRADCAQIWLARREIGLNVMRELALVSMWTRPASIHKVAQLWSSTFPCRRGLVLLHGLRPLAPALLFFGLDLVGMRRSLSGNGKRRFDLDQVVVLDVVVVALELLLDRLLFFLSCSSSSSISSNVALVFVVVFTVISWGSTGWEVGSGGSDLKVGGVRVVEGEKMSKGIGVVDAVGVGVGVGGRERDLLHVLEREGFLVVVVIVVWHSTA